MKIFDAGLDFLDALYTLSARATKQHLAAYVDLEGTESDEILTFRDGSVASFIQIKGIKTLVGEKEFSETVRQLSQSLQAYMKGGGHAIQVVFSRDPDLTQRDLSSSLAPARKAARAIGLQVEDIIDERVTHLSRYTNSENCFFIIYTRPSALTRAESNELSVERKEGTTGLPYMSPSQDFSSAANAIIVKHESFVHAFCNDLKTIDVTMEVLDVHSAIKEIRMEIDAEFTSDEWRPMLRGDVIAARMPPLGTKIKYVGSYVGLPSITRQLFPRDIHNIGLKTVQVGERVYSPMFMDIGPQNLTAFSGLFSRVEFETPWRISFLIESGALEAMSLKSTIASLLSWSSADNRAIKASINSLRELEADGGSVVKLRVAFTSWANYTDPKSLIKRTSSLARAVDGWGICSAREETGDPVMGFISTLPGASLNSVATASAAPLHSVVAMLPIMRPASPWDEGAVLFRTIDGKIWPYQPGSGKQVTWIDLIFAKPGSGKSVLMSAMNLAICMTPGAKRLPRITVIDIGPSSSGLINMLRDSLPVNQQHQVGYHRLQMAKEYCINPFDTQLGCREALYAERAFLKNFLTLLSTPVGQSEPYPSAAELAGAVVDEVYKYFSDGANPNRYSRLTNDAVDAALEQYNINVDAETTWYEIVDALAAKNEFKLAAEAQRYAVPLISDCIMIAQQDPTIKSLYGKVILETHETVIEAFCRMLSSSVKEYPVLSGPTRFDVSDTKVLAIDLEEVAKSGGDAANRQTAVMYMLARYASCKDYYLTEAILEVVNAQYKTYHEKRVFEVGEDMKRICFDEFHRTSMSKAVRDQVEIDMREGRKWGVQVCLASQSVEDFDDNMIEFSTNVFIMGAGQRAIAEKLGAKFGLTETAVDALANHVKAPTSAGAPFVLMSSTKEGLYTQLLYSTIGPKEMWSFSTTKQDVILRNQIAQLTSTVDARVILSRYFPGGSAVNEITRRSLLVGDGNFSASGDDDKGIISQMVTELLKRAVGDNLIEGFAS